MIPERTRLAVEERASGHCEDCGQRCTIEMHHLHYDTTGREEPEALAALCRDCHNARHVDQAGDFWADPQEKESHWLGYHSAMEQD